MFENLVECAKNKKSNKRWSYFVVTAVAWIMVLLGAVAAGIYFYDAQLDQNYSLLCILAPPLPPPPPPAPAAGGNISNAKPQPATPKEIIAPPTMPVRNAPTSIDLPPTRVVYTDPNATGSGEPGIGLPTGATGGTGNGDPFGVIGGTGKPANDNPPKPPEAEEKKIVKDNSVSVIRRSEGVIRGNTVFQAKPDYPTLARNAHIQGDVVIDITISEDGSVISAKVVSGHPLLAQSALNAARQWRFNPTMLNSSPVKVQGMLTFRFTL
jgi:protein TonB